MKEESLITYVILIVIIIIIVIALVNLHRERDEIVRGIILGEELLEQISKDTRKVDGERTFDN